MVVGVSAEMILAFKKFSGQKKATLQDMFKSLSVEMGGDGKTITKSQLSTYIQKAESGTTKLSPTRLQALKKMLANWDNISKDGESITFSDMQSMPMLLFDAAVGDFNNPDKTKKSDDEQESDKFDVQEYLKNALNIPEDGEIKKSDIESHLKSVLSDSSNDATGIVDTLTNVIATYNSTTTVEAIA